MSFPMQRRGFVAMLGGAALWPLAAAGQQQGRIRRIGVIMGLSESDAEAQLRVRAFQSSWRELGWVEGRSVHVDYRWAPGGAENARAHAAAVVAADPEVILALGTSILAAVRLATRSIPIVFAGISDPEGAGIVASLSRPGANLTGFANFEPPIVGKWLETLKEAAPNLRRVAVLRNAEGHPRFMGTAERLASSFGMESIDCRVENAGEIERTLTTTAAGQPNTGLIVIPDPILTPRRRIVELAADHRMPAIYPFRSYADEGGLMSYGVDIADQVRRAAFYIDRILKGEKPADMPVQAPTKFELVINLRTAKALGLDIPPTLLARADEVIE